jgi:hypothetical protein
MNAQVRSYVAIEVSTLYTNTFNPKASQKSEIIPIIDLLTLLFFVPIYLLNIPDNIHPLSLHQNIPIRIPIIFDHSLAFARISWCIFDWTF